jgi:uncharacterized protein YjbI with pentapeptide repeats
MHSRNPNKDKDAFNSIIKKQIESNDYNFQGYFFPVITFNEKRFYNADFSGAIYYGYVSFEKAIFYGYTRFESSNFLDDVNFSKAIFNGYADFRFITFSEQANFSFTQYHHSASFLHTKFYSYANFWFCTFKEKSDFEYARFIEFANFRGINIEGKLIFSWINYDLNPNYFNGDFSILEIREQGSLIFEHSSLSKIRFEDSDLRIPQFYAVTWRRYWGRNVIHDEMELRQRENVKITNSLISTSYLADVSINYINYNDIYPFIDEAYPRFGDIEKLYRELKINYEIQEDYKNAGDFHYGEMEMHRRGSKWCWFPFYWYNIYRWLSGYGERPSWALGWLAVFLSVLTGLVWWLNLEIIDTKQLADLGDSFIYLLQKVTLQRPIWAEPMGFWGKLVSGFSVLLIPGQAALFLLALRNRLGRRR